MAANDNHHQGPNSYALHMREQAYNSLTTFWRSSILKKFLTQTPKAIDYEMRHGSKDPTPAMEFGTAFHARMQSLAAYQHLVIVAPPLDLRTKHGRETKEALRIEAKSVGGVVISQEQADAIEAMYKNVCANHTAQELLQNTHREVSVFSKEIIKRTDSINQINVKCRCDAIGPNWPLILDFKTCANASYAAMQRTILKYQYHVSAAMYLSVVNSCPELLKLLNRERFDSFVLICIESEPPYQVACYDLAAYLPEGETLYREALARLCDAIIANFPGYPDFLRTIEPPRYTNPPIDL